MKIMCLLVLAGMAGSLDGQQVSEQNTEVVIRALERQWAEAQGRNDNRALDLIFDNALVYVEYGKLVSKPEYLSRIHREVVVADDVVMETISVRTFKATTIVVGTYREKQRKGGQILIRRWRYVDTWVYKQNSWKLVAAGSTPVVP